MSYWKDKENALRRKAERGELSGADANEIVLTLLGGKDELTSRVKENEKKSAKNGTEITIIQEEYPLLPPEADDLSNAVKKKGVFLLGGKKSNAYKNIDLRKRVFRDIYSEIKRQYGLIDEKGRQQSYKKLKRKYLKGAFIVVDEYELPIALANEIDAENELEDMD